MHKPPLLAQILDPAHCGTMRTHLSWSGKSIIVSSPISLGAVAAEVALIHISDLGGQRNGKMDDGDAENKINHC